MFGNDPVSYPMLLYYYYGSWALCWALAAFLSSLILYIACKYPWMWDRSDRLCGLVVRVPGYTTEMYCVSCEIRTEFIYVM
jgi:hypothetical protein